MNFTEFVLFCFLSISVLVGVKGNSLFIIQCSNAQKSELLYFGTCNGENQNVYPKMMDIVSEIKNFDQESTLDYFLTEYIFSNTSKYFETKYKNNTRYLDSLTKLKTELTSLLSKMRSTLSDVTIFNFITAFQKSAFNSIVKEIYTNNENLINSLELNNPLRNNLTCQQGTFCQLTTKILNIRFSNELNDLTIKLFLNHFIENGFNYINNLFFLNDKIEAEKMIEEWNNKGTKNIKMSEVTKFVENRLISDILYVYEPYKTTKLRTTTKFIRKTTTRIQKVIDEFAVSDGVLWSIPLVILFLTIVGSVGIAYHHYRFKPQKLNQVIEMENKKTNF